jgi:uncharacterized protein (TIGR02145 family)
MAENLNFNAANSKCYENQEKNCAKYGRLYNWETALGACPAGWRLPLDAEWTALINVVGGEETADRKLKLNSGWDKNGNGTNESGFSALPGGIGGSDDNFYNVGRYGHWWSAEEYNEGGAWRIYMAYNGERVVMDPGGKEFLLSVRCVED